MGNCVSKSTYLSRETFSLKFAKCSIIVHLLKNDIALLGIGFRSVELHALPVPKTKKSAKQNP